MTTISNSVRPPFTLASLRWIERLTDAERKALINAAATTGLDESWLWRARKDQKGPYDTPPVWLMLGGRGSGKTYAGAGWVVDRAWEGGRIALIGPSLHDVREVMIEGPSGVMQMAPSDDRPRWEGSRRRLVWQGGAIAYALSAEDPESLRGPQFHAAWADELCAWREPQRVLDTLRFGLRLGRRPRLAVTTTPRPIPALRRLMTAPGTAVTRMATAANAANLSPGFLEQLTALYGGTRLAAQELEGLVTEGEGALFRAEDLGRARAVFTGEVPAYFERVVVAVDPPITTGGDACGIVAAGRLDERVYVLADRSVRGLTPGGWAARVAETARAFGADRVLAEANQGGSWAPAHLSVTAEEGGLMLGWIARTRRDGDRWDGETQGSDPLRFRVRVLDGEAVVRMFEVEAETALYATADQAADFPGGPGEGARVAVSQWSPVFGWGVEAMARLPS